MFGKVFDRQMAVIKELVEGFHAGSMFQGFDKNVSFLLGGKNEVHGIDPSDLQGGVKKFISVCSVTSSEASRDRSLIYSVLLAIGVWPGLVRGGQRCRCKPHFYQMLSDV